MLVEVVGGCCWFCVAGCFAFTLCCDLPFLDLHWLFDLIYFCLLVIILVVYKFGLRCGLRFLFALCLLLGDFVFCGLVMAVVLRRLVWCLMCFVLRVWWCFIVVFFQLRSL